MFNKDTDICQLKGVGTKSEYFYRKLGINTVRNLLSHIPFRYQDSSNIISINVFKELKEGTFLGKIEEVKELGSYIVEAINTNNKELAQELLNKIKIILKQTIQQN